MVSNDKIELLKSLGYTIVADTGYGNLQVMCSNGHTFNRRIYNFESGSTACLECEKDNKKKIVENYGYTLISVNKDMLTIMCSKKHIFTKRWSHFSKGSTTCLECEQENKRNKLETLGYELLSIESKKVKVQCRNGHIFTREWGQFNCGNTTCLECEKDNKKKVVESYGYYLLSVEGRNINVKCINGHTFSKHWGQFSKGSTTCLECEQENRKKFLTNLGHTVIDTVGRDVIIRCSNNHVFTRSWGTINKGATKCPICFPENSSQEIELHNFLKENNINFYNNTYKIISKELDIFIPEKKLAIEFNGVYWHSELAGKTQKYHLEKTEDCSKQNIELLHIFENEWQNPTKKEIWKSIILGKLGKHQRIFARKTTLKEVSKEEEKKFLYENHLQGFVGSRVCLGLYINEDLLCLMSFGKNRFSSEVEWELLRFVSKKYISVVGGASKLFKHFVNNYSNGLGIVSYSDRRYSQGNMYSKLGFKFSHNSQPNYFYFKNSLHLESRQKYMKHKLKNILENFDEDLTEWQNMQNNGFNRIWDCGNSVWIY